LEKQFGNSLKDKQARRWWLMPVVLGGAGDSC
jgi:hypothetical protein